MVLMVKVGIRGRTKLEAEFEVCYTIVYVEGEGCLAGSSGPDIDIHLEAPEEGGLLRH